MTGLNRNAVELLIMAALKEDLGVRDLTSCALIPKGQNAKAEIVVRREGVVAGLQVVEWTFGAVEPKVRFQPMARDGQKVFPGKAVAFLEGPARGILAGERVALNFLSRLSGIATLTRAFVEKVRGTPAKIYDTRKTTPTLRLLEKYAVAAGGGANHRTGLYDAVLIKDNHLRLVASQPAPEGKALSPIERAVAGVRASAQKQTVVEVEVANLPEFRQGMSARVDIILLDNMKLSEIQEAAKLRNALARSKRGRRVLLEVSGGLNLENVRSIAATGVERISVGALTHSAPALDLSLEIL